MRKIILLSLFICFNIAVSGQVRNSVFEIQKVRILEICNNHGNIDERDFEIVLEDGFYTMYEIGTHTDEELIALAKPSLQKVLQRLDKQKGRYKRIIKKLAETLPPPKKHITTYNYEEITALDKVFKMPHINHPLQSFGIDYYWIKENKERLWQEFTEKNNINWNDSLNALVLQNLDNYQLLVEFSKIKIPTHNIKKCFIDIDVFTNSSENSWLSFVCYPWGGREDYNHLISSTIANILPKSRSLAKPYFEAVNFENIISQLIKKVYDFSIESKVSKLNLDDFPALEKLQKYFNIEKAEIEDLFRKKYLLLDLKPFKLTSNIRYTAYLNPRKNSKQIEKFIFQLPEIEQQLTSNFIYEYMLQDIHTRSLEIKYYPYRNQVLFKNQVEDIKRKFAGKIENLSQQLKKAIEVTFYKDLKDDFQTSYWILLPSGMSILWQFEGEKVLEINKSDLPSSTCILFDKNGNIVNN